MTVNSNRQSKPKISVVVPVYNVDSYLDKCLNSIRNQTLAEIEIIVVNDGSTDNSARIVMAHASLDQRITVVEQENRGYGAAINVGISRVRGEYVSIIDSDDWLEPNMLQTLYALATKHDADIAKCTYAMRYLDGSRTPVHFGRHMVTSRDIARSSSSLDLLVFPSSIWSGLYRTQLLQENQILMIETPGAAYQDVTWKFLCYSSTDNIVLKEEPLYNYRIRDTGSSRVNRGNLEAHFKNYRYIKQFLYKHALWEKNKQAFFIHQFTDLEFHCRRLEKKDGRQLCRKFSSVLIEAETNGIPVRTPRFVRNDAITNYKRRVAPLIALVAYYEARQRRAWLKAIVFLLQHAVLRLRRSKLVWGVLYTRAARVQQADYANLVRR